MFVKRVDPTPYHHFVFDTANGFFLVFKNADMSGTREKPFMPHWVAPCGDRRSLDAMCRWTAARRDKWQEWGELAGRIGRQAFSRHMHQLIEDEPLAEVVGTLFSRGDDPLELLLGETLQGPNGLRSEVLYVHRFKTAADYHAFNKLCFKTENRDIPQTLVAVGYNEGSDAVGELIEKLVAGARSKRRRGGERARKAA